MEPIYRGTAESLHSRLFAPILAYLECLMHGCPEVTASLDPDTPVPPSFEMFLKHNQHKHKFALLHDHLQHDRGNWVFAKNKILLPTSMAHSLTEKPCQCLACKNSTICVRMDGQWKTNVNITPSKNSLE